MTMPLHAPKPIGRPEPDAGAARPARTIVPAAGVSSLTETMVAVTVAMLVAAIFVFDALTPADDVSIPFLYTIPIFVTLFSRYQLSYVCAGVTIALSVVGTFIQPPREGADWVFATNRTIAIASQWLVAFLVAMRRQAEARMRADFEVERNKAEVSRRFIDVLSHEIGTSLTTIDGHAFRMRKLSADRDDMDLAARSEKIRKAVRHVESVVRQVQLVSEVGEGAVVCRPQAVSLAELINDVLLDAGDTHPIATDLSALPASVQADADLMRQTVGNLLSNAVKYSPPGSPIEIRGYAERGDAVIVVSDRGRGIASDEMAKLGEPYFRGRNSQGIHGTGIGLYISRRFVASHGGTLDIRSALGAGTTATVRIPIDGMPEIAP